MAAEKKTTEKKKETKKSITIPIPSGNSFQIILILLLVAAAFGVGSLWSKVKQLEKGQAGTSITAGNNAPSAPSVPSLPASLPAHSVASACLGAFECNCSRGKCLYTHITSSGYSSTACCAVG